MQFLSIDLSNFTNLLRIRQHGGARQVYDPVRKKYVALTPEEFVRQALIQYLTREMSYNKNFLSVEKQIRLREKTWRFDLMVYDPQHQAFLLCECKAPQVDLSQETFDQIARYNLPLRVPYLLVTNGRQTACCRMDHDQRSYQFFDKLPNYPKMQ